MKPIVRSLLFAVLLLQVAGVHAQSELWGTDFMGSAIFKIDGTNPAPANFVKKLALATPTGGGIPSAGLTLYSNGKLYGITQGGGSSGLGVLFEYDPATGIFAKKVDFDGINGSHGVALTLAANGKLYGTTYQGGVSNNGVLFEYDPVTNTYTKKVDFDGTLKGSSPTTTLTPAPNGKLYGMTSSGGAFAVANGGGVLFEYDPATSTYTKRVDFSGTANGANPRTGPLALGGNGKLYGVTYAGGTSNGGVLFEFDPSTNVFTKKVDFSNGGVAGYNPYGGLVLAGNGKLYGTTLGGDASSLGVLFEYDYTSNSYAVKHDFLFDDAGAEIHGGLTLAGNGKLYGVTFIGGGVGDNGTGALFEYDPTSNTFTTKMQFNSPVFNPDHPKGATGRLLFAQTQTITGFAAIPNKTYGDTPFTVSATGGASGNPVTFISSDPAIATVSGNTVAINGIGTVTITAYQAGTTTYLAAGVPQTFIVSLGPPKTAQTITFNTLADKVVGDAAFGLTGTATSGLAVTYASSNPDVATVSGSTVTVVGAGTTVITASQEGNTTFHAAVPVSQALTVNKTNQTITFSAPGDKNVGDANFNLTATASSSLAVSYTSSNTAVATVSGSTVTIVGIGTTIITASQPGNGSYNAASPVSQILTVNRTNQTITFTALADKTVGDADFSLTATASSSLPVSYSSSNTAVATVLGNVLTIAGAGTTTITASQAGNAGYSAAPDVSQSLTVNKGNQTITFGALIAKTFGDAPFNLTGTASSGLAVSYVSSNTSVATVSGSAVTIIGAGTTTITASQAGNASYNAAADAPQTFVVGKANQTITFNPLPTKTAVDAPFELTGTASSGLPLNYFSSNTTVATVSGSTVTIVGGGTTTIGVTQGGNSNYNMATPVAQTLTVNRLPQSITFPPPPTKTVGDAPFNLTATASSGLPVTYFSTNTLVATISGSTVTIVGAGSATISAVQGGNDIYGSAATVAVPLTVVRLNQSITFISVPNKTVSDPPFNLTATATSGLPVSFTSSNPSVVSVSGSTATVVGAGTVMITATQGGNASYSTATPVSRTLTVNKLNQTITFGTLTAKTVGDAAFDLSATASSGLPVSFTSSNTAVATVSGNTVTVVGGGSAIITALQPGDAMYNAATAVTQMLVVNKANQTITFNPLANKTVGDANFNLTATASSSLPVSYTSSNASVATISGNTVTIVGTGTTVITASQAGDASFNAAPSVAQSLTVTTNAKSDQTITFSAIPDQFLADGTLVLAATASSGLPVNYASSNSLVATISGSTVTFVGGGTAIITASQAGDGSYNPAIDVPRVLKVLPKDQTIAFGTLSAKTYGDAPFTLAATATSGLPVSYFSSNPSVAIVSDNLVTIVGAGTAVITAWQGGNNDYDAANNVDQTLTVSKASQSITFGVLTDKRVGDAAFNLTAVSSTGLPVSYTSSNPAVATVSGNLVTITGAGSTVITASQAGNTNYNAAAPVAPTLTVKANQTITFNALVDKSLGNAPFNLTAIASSGLAVSYTSSNPSVATISGSTVTIVGAGATIITASQAGNASFAAAASVTQTLTVNKAEQTISFAFQPNHNVGAAPFNLTGSATSGLAVSYTSSNTNVATVSGNTVTLVGAGTTIITASQSGNANFNAAVPVSQTLTVNKLNQTIVFNNLLSKNMGDAAFDLTATTTSGLPISYISSNPSVASISGGTVTIVGAGTTMITAMQSGNASYNAAFSITQPFTVNKLNQSITFNTLPGKNTGDAAFDLNGTATSGLAVSYASSNPFVASISGSTVTILNSGTTVITASQSGNASYNAASSVTQTLTVNKLNQSITFNAPVSKVVGDAAFNLTSASTSGLPVFFDNSNPAVATVSGNTVTIVGAGTTIITALQPGDAVYNAAVSVAQVLTVNKANQSITFNTLADKTVGDAAFNLSATASSALAVSYTSSNSSVATVSGNTVTIVGAGTTIITASQPGNGNFNAATPVSQTLTVNKSSQTITFNTLADKSVGDPTFNLSATAISGLTVSFASNNPAVATVAGNTVTIVGAGTTIITASQAGNGNFNAATPVSQTLTVNKSNQTITFNALDDRNVGDPTFNLSATATSGLTVSYVSSNTSIATVSGNTVTIVGAGSTIITASQPGNANYNAATPVSQTLTINKTSQTITFNVLANKVVGDADFALTATASSGLAVGYLSSNPLVATVSGNTVTIVGTGTTVITASQPGNASYYAAAAVSQSLTVTAGSKTDQTITFAALPDKIFGDDNFMLAATTSSGLPVSYVSSNESVATISGNAVTIVGAGITVITASQPGNTSYNAAIEVSRTLTINKRDQTIAFSSLADKTVGDMAFSLTATASSGLAVTYSAASDRVTITGTSVDVVKPGRATIIASQGGNAGYNQANSVSQSFCIKPAKPTITITNGDTGSPVLTSSAHEGNQWFLNDAVIPGATNATWHAVQPGIYKVQVKVDDCVSDFSADQPLIVTGIAENHDDNMKVELYPNPATDWLHVSLGSLPGRKDITIFQMNGLETVSRQVDGQEARFSLIDYPKGMYVVKVKSGNRMRLIRFVKL